jgi:hypothetical protein
MSPFFFCNWLPNWVKAKNNCQYLVHLRRFMISQRDDKNSVNTLVHLRRFMLSHGEAYRIQKEPYQSYLSESNSCVLRLNPKTNKLFCLIKMPRPSPWDTGLHTLGLDVLGQNVFKSLGP